MKKIIKIQIIKLFYNAEYLGYNLIGALLVILYGWGYSAAILENEMNNFKTRPYIMKKCMAYNCHICYWEDL